MYETAEPLSSVDLDALNLQPLTITLSRCGEVFALADWEALTILRGYTWSVHKCGKGKTYARAQRCPISKQPLRLYMHRLIAEHFLGPAPSPKHVVDHKNGDGLDNRACNLRSATAYDNRWRTARWGSK